MWVDVFFPLKNEMFAVFPKLGIVGWVGNEVDKSVFNVGTRNRFDTSHEAEENGPLN